VDVDQKRELFTLEVVDREGSLHPARALSDGTLRFLALSILELDPDARGLLCFEEPENGIHPKRVAAMLRLLEDLSVDTDEPIGPENPLRQVIINTHSPAVVGQVKDADLLIAEPREAIVKAPAAEPGDSPATAPGKVGVKEDRCRAVAFSWLTDMAARRVSRRTHGLSGGARRVPQSAGLFG
jgi:hypothetical protein